jgi:hypothetical protein
MYLAGGVLAHPTLAGCLGHVSKRHLCGRCVQSAFPRWQKKRSLSVRAQASRVEQVWLQCSMYRGFCLKRGRLCEVQQSRSCLQAKYSRSKPWQERAFAGIVGAAAAVSIALAGPAQAGVQPFLSSTGKACQITPDTLAHSLAHTCKHIKLTSSTHQVERLHLYRGKGHHC